MPCIERNCGASDVIDYTIQTNNTLQLLNFQSNDSIIIGHDDDDNNNANIVTSVEFTIPFMPPFKGMLDMFGTATNIPTFHSMVEQQPAGLQGVVCAPG